jgi:ATP-dependent RNA helicase DDX27
MQADFNPGFSFNLGQGNDDYQAPWEFKGKLDIQFFSSCVIKIQTRYKRMHANWAICFLSTGALEQANTSKGTSIDFKIQKHAASKPKRGSRKRDADDITDGGAVGPALNEGDDEQPRRKNTKQNSIEGLKQNVHSNTDIQEQQQRATAAAAPPTVEEQDSEDDDDDDALEQQYHKNATKKQSKSSFFNAAPEGTTFAAASFADLNLSRPLVRACAALGYSKPTPIQAACIPLALTGRDICGSAITGSGKTAAFSLPLLERLMHRSRRVAATYVLVLTPTRELAVQVHSMIQKLAQFTDIQAALVVGGLSLQAQAAALRAGPEIVVATPVRLF